MSRHAGLGRSPVRKSGEKADVDAYEQSGNAARRMSLGRLGERLVVLAYRRKGYDILSTNWRSSGGGVRGEIDIVASRGGALIFCEVKTRTQDRYGAPEEAVTPSKQARLKRLAGEWLNERRADGSSDSYFREIRFDVAAVVLGEDGRLSVRLIEDAF